ncbi:gag/pol polyprotein, related [Gossypium australe]|uniref:Gag/pol polyprotein, related n=1 Tax=Gossypium australe TaxID=47621 RepID=A0A5B6X469_9ROSI|nr:gag/pol polyprotein, related [Gossypium australe]
MLSVKQTREPITMGQSSQEAKLASQDLDLDSLDVRDEHWNKKPKTGEHTDTLQLFYDNEERNSAADMSSVDSQIIVHKLNVFPEAKPIKQKRKKFAPQVVEAVRQEVT